MKQNLCSLKAKIKTYEVIIILIFSSILPAFLTTILLFKNSDLNYLKFISFYFLIFLILLTLLNLILNKPYLALFYGCHCKVERSFKYIYKYFFLCARCSGIYLGMISMAFLSFIKFNYNYLLFLVIPLIIDGIIQKKTSYQSNNTKRVITGFLFGLAFIVLLATFFYYQAKLIIYISKLLWD